MNKAILCLFKLKATELITHFFFLFKYIATELITFCKTLWTSQVLGNIDIDVNGKVTFLDLVNNKTIVHVHVCGNLQNESFI